MPQSQAINNQLLTGQQTFNFSTANQPWLVATVTIDRTVANGLNTLSSNATLTVGIQYSPDGNTWIPVAAATFQGGVMITKGVTLASETLAIGIGQLFATGTAFRITTDASTSVRISGTVVYS